VAEAEQIQIKSAENIIFKTLLGLMRARGVSGTVVRPESRLNQDLGMDSLDLAELSAVLEDELGRDPFSDGLLPATAGELISYYHT
jgi:acyl carrier protein